MNTDTIVVSYSAEIESLSKKPKAPKWTFFKSLENSLKFISIIRFQIVD